MKRVQLDFSDKHFEEIVKLQAITNITTRKDLFESALTLLEWSLEQVKDGKKIGCYDKDEDNFCEIVMPIFRNINIKGE